MVSKTMDALSDEGKLLLSTFTVNNYRQRLFYKRGTLQWSPEDSSRGGNVSLPITDVVAVGVSEAKNTLTVTYVEAISSCRMQMREQEMHHEDSETVVSWHQALNAELTALKTRPRTFLVLVNPHCGKRRGVRIYKKKVEPLFKMAGVVVELVITKDGNHGPELISTTDLTLYDAIVAVGGDGTVSEIANSLVRRTLRDSMIDPSDAEAIRNLPRVRIPLAVIPAGSTDCIAYTLNGTDDPETAAIYALLGDSVGLDVCSLASSNRGLIKVFLSTLGYGFLGDVVKTSEKYRWMGPKRYEYTGALKEVLRQQEQKTILRTIFSLHT